MNGHGHGKADPGSARVAAGKTRAAASRDGGSLRAAPPTTRAGRPLPPALKHDLGARMGQDFGAVRLHDDAAARSAAEALNAHAYTVGDDVVLGEGVPPLDTVAGRHLIAHELAHVVQQRRGGPPPALTADAAHEIAASRAASAVSAGSNPVGVAGATGVGVAREEKKGPRKRSLKSSRKSNRAASSKPAAKAPARQVDPEIDRMVERGIVEEPATQPPAQSPKTRQVRSTRESRDARRSFNTKRDSHAQTLSVTKGGQVHHGIELQALKRYPGAFTSAELNAPDNMRGMRPELSGKRQLHNSKIREVWDRHYNELDRQLKARGLKKGTQPWRDFVRRYLMDARAEMDHNYGNLYSEAHAEEAARGKRPNPGKNAAPGKRAKPKATSRKAPAATSKPAAPQAKPAAKSAPATGPKTKGQTPAAPEPAAPKAAKPKAAKTRAAAPKPAPAQAKPQSATPHSAPPKAARPKPPVSSPAPADKAPAASAPKATKAAAPKPSADAAPVTPKTSKAPSPKKTSPDKAARSPAAPRKPSAPRSKAPQASAPKALPPKSGSTPAKAPGSTAKAPVPPKPVVEPPPPVKAPSTVAPKAGVPEAPAPKGLGAGFKSLGGGLLSLGLPIVAGMIHAGAVADRIEKKADETGYVPYGAPSGEGLLYDLGSWLLDPTNEADKSVGIEQRFKVSPWRQNLREKAAEKSPGDTIDFNWQKGKCSFDIWGNQEYDDVEVIYKKGTDGRWSVESGDASGTPDFNDIISDEVPDDKIESIIMVDPCQA
ncbi:MAG: DUF4157 domain-containing protein [Rhodanobacteraceae bacterium]|nr:DUF4157 domain-containing protein [Rhodanobacteraceae bacterium]